MRALIFVVIAAIVGGGGYFFYRQSASTAPESGGMFAEAPPPELPKPEDCTVANATYVYNEDPRLRLHFEAIPVQGDGVEIYDVRLRRAGNMNLIVQATSLQAEYRFTPDNQFMAQGPLYQTIASYFRPEAGGTRLRVSMFDSDMRYIRDMPRNDSVAPAYIYIPELMGALYAHRIDLPPGAFRFATCAEPAAPATP